MSEDADAKTGGRRRRTTRAGRRRAGRAPSQHAEPGSSEQWSPAWSSDPDTLPGDIVEEVEDVAESTEHALADEADAETTWENPPDRNAADEEDSRATGELVVSPFTLAELQDDEKTNPRIRVGDMGPQHPAELEPVVGPAVAIWSRPSTRIGSESEEPVVAIRPAVVITPQRIISDRPPPMASSKAREPSAIADPPRPATSSTVAVATEDVAAPASREQPARERSVAATVETEREPAPAAPIQTSFEPFGESEPPPPVRPGADAGVVSDANGASIAFAAAGEAAAAEVQPAPAAPAPEAAPTPPTAPSPPPPLAAASLTERATKPPAIDAAPDEGSLQIVDVDVAELEQARRSRTPPPPPPDARSKAAPPKRPPPPPVAAKGDDDRQKRKQVRQWWERFFSDDYLMSVRPATQAQIAKQVDFIEQSLGIGKGGTVLDVGCGLGLHAVELTRRGYLVVGLDLSLAMITRAAELAQQQQLKLNVVHADIREMEFDGAFDGVICMGTTFGFFDDDANRDMLARLHQALRPGGRLLLDMVNRDYVIGFQPNLVWFEGDECVCMEESDFNYFNSRLTVKRTMMREDGKQSNAEYSVRLYSLHELGMFMQQVGFRVIEVSGQEAIRGAFFGANSPRILMLAERRPIGRPSAVIPLDRNGADQGRPPAIPPERGSAEVPKIPKPD